MNLQDLNKSICAEFDEKYSHTDEFGTKYFRLTPPELVAFISTIPLRVAEAMREEADEMRRAMLVFSKMAMLVNPNEADSAWNDVYMLAHSFSETCPHPEWRKHLEELERNLKEL